MKTAKKKIRWCLYLLWWSVAFIPYLILIFLIAIVLDVITGVMAIKENPAVIDGIKTYIRQVKTDIRLAKRW